MDCDDTNSNVAESCTDTDSDGNYAEDNDCDGQFDDANSAAVTVLNSTMAPYLKFNLNPSGIC